MSDHRTSPRNTKPHARLRRIAIATALIGASVVVGGGLLVPTAAAAALCATPPLTGTTSITGVINTYYPGQRAAVAGYHSDRRAVRIGTVPRWRSSS